MLTSDFDYHLPSERIAQEALPRGTSRLFCVDQPAGLQHRQIADLPELLRPGDLLVLNDTKVIPARLFGLTAPDNQGQGGGKVEILLVEKLANAEWQCLTKPGKRTRPGAEILLAEDLRATVVEKLDAGLHRVQFSAPIEPHLARLGHVPLPPYIKRDGDEHESVDRERYQTVWAQRPGAIAAPTAGLHFDHDLLERLESRGIETATVTLHVGIGTFKPVNADLVHEHRMDEERYEIPEESARRIEAARATGRRIVAVGTTVVRTLESVAALGDGTIRVGAGRTNLFITPGYRFGVVDLLLTNFHLPRSTLLMLVSAFAGRERVLAAYEEAIGEDYRFYSYGDAMLLERRQ